MTVEVIEGVDNLQPCADSSGRIVLMRCRIAKVHQHPVAQYLGDIAFEAADRSGADLLIGVEHTVQFFGVELCGEGSGAHQVAEYHGELAAFGFGARSGESRGVRGWWLARGGWAGKRLRRGRELCGFGSAGCWRSY